MTAALDRYLTFSVDDGAPQDLRTAELLDELGLVATFYVPARNPDRPLLDRTSIRELARRFEVGGHSFSHRRLKGLPEAEIHAEVADGKAWIEETIGEQVVSFCYPLGKFDSRVAAVVQQCGFLGARTCFFNLIDWPADLFLLGLSTHAYSHSAPIQLRHALLERNFAGIWNYSTLFRLCRDWEQHFTLALDHVQAHGANRPPLFPQLGDRSAGRVGEAAAGVEGCGVARRLPAGDQRRSVPTHLGELFSLRQLLLFANFLEALVPLFLLDQLHLLRDLERLQTVPAELPHLAPEIGNVHWLRQSHFGFHDIPQQGILLTHHHHARHLRHQLQDALHFGRVHLFTPDVDDFRLAAKDFQELALHLYRVAGTGTIRPR